MDGPQGHAHHPRMEAIRGEKCYDTNTFPLRISLSFASCGLHKHADEWKNILFSGERNDVPFHMAVCVNVSFLDILRVISKLQLMTVINL